MGWGGRRGRVIGDGGRCSALALVRRGGLIRSERAERQKSRHKRRERKRRKEREKRMLDQGQGEWEGGADDRYRLESHVAYVCLFLQSLFDILFN